MFKTTTRVLITQLEAAFPKMARDLDPEGADLVTRLADLAFLERDEELLPEGRLTGTVFVLRGRLTVARSEDAPPDHRWVVGQGEVIGLECLLDRPSSVRSVRALESSETRTMSADAWARLRRERPRTAAGLLRTLSRELAAEVDAIRTELERPEQ